MEYPLKSNFDTREDYLTAIEEHTNKIKKVFENGEYTVPDGINSSNTTISDLTFFLAQVRLGLIEDTRPLDREEWQYLMYVYEEEIDQILSSSR